MCRWYWGPTRLGKSWKAISDMEFNITMDKDMLDLDGLFIKNSSNKWWDGYFN